MEKTDDVPAYIVPSYGIGLRMQSSIHSSQGEMTDRMALPTAASSEPPPGGSFLAHGTQAGCIPPRGTYIRNDRVLELRPA